MQWMLSATDGWTGYAEGPGPWMAAANFKPSSMRLLPLIPDDASNHVNIVVSDDPAEAGLELRRMMEKNR